MATLLNYGAALGQTLKDSAKGIVSGFGSGLKGAMLSEVPLLTAGYGAFSSLRKDASNIGGQQSTSVTPPVGQGSSGSSGSPTKSSITGNPFAHMIQQLAQINANTAFSARADKASLQAEQYKQMFGEEEARERAQQNKALIDAIKNSGLGGGGKGKTEEEGSESPFGKFFGGILGNIGKWLMKGLRGLGSIIVAGFTAAMPFLRKMLTKVLSFALKRALFLIPGIGLILGTAALAYDVADMAGAFDGGDTGGGVNAAAGGKKGSAGLSMIDRARQSMGIPVGGTRPDGDNAGEKGSGVTAQPTPTGKPPRYKTPQEFDQEIARFSKTSNPNLPSNARYIATLQAEKAALVGGATSSPKNQGVSNADMSEGTKKQNYSNKGSERKLSMIDRARLSMGIPVGGTSPTSGVSGGAQSNSPVGQPTTSGANKTTGIKWRVPLRNSYTVTSEFGEQRGEPKYKKSYTHKGVDLALYYGAPVVAAADGRITVNTHNDRSGNFVMMDHGNGYTSLYAHLHMSNSIPGTEVTAGTVIGYVGSSGVSSAPHLHFEIRLNDVSKDPRDFMQLGKKAQLTKVDREAEIPKPGNTDSGEVGAKGSALQAKKVSITPSSSTSKLIEMGDGRVAEAYAGAGVNSPSPMTSAQVDAEIRRAAGKGYYTQREQDASTQRVLKELGGIRENTHKTFKEVKSNRITMSGGKFKSPELLLREANKQFRDSLQKQLTRTISGSLMKALYPGGYKNVSQQTATGQMYRGEQLNKMLGVTPALTKLGTSIFGKQYGPAFGQIFSKVGTAYMEVGARSVAQGIFGSAFKGAGMKDGVAEEQANILGGQILGNLAKGTKQGKLTALEQIIYGASGGKVALGAETIFAKYGFASPQDGIGYMANVLGAGIMGPIDSALGTTPSSMANMDPRMRQMGAFGGYGGEYGGMPSNMVGAGSSRGNLNLGQAQNALAANPAFAYDDAGRLSVRAGSPESTEQTRLLTQQINLAKEREIQAKKDFSMDLKTADERAELQRVISDSQYEQQVKTNEILSQRPTSGSSAGGFFNQLLGVNAGDKGMMGAFAEVGNMALDFGKAALTQKVVQKLGIKNPYMQLLASAAVNKGLSIGGEYAFNAIKGTEAGSSIINYASTALAGAKTAFPSIFGASAAPTATSIASGNALALGVAPGTLAAPAATTAATTLGGTAAAGTAATTAAAAGTVAAGSTAATAALAAETAAAASAGNLALGYGSYAGGAAAASPLLVAAPYILAAIVIFKMLTKKSKPKPIMSRIIRVLENNDINAKTFSNVDVGFDPPPNEWQPAADALLNVGFNATKNAEVETKEKSPFEFIMVTIENDGIKFHADSGDPKNSKQFVGLGKLDNTFNSSTAASTIIKFVADIFKRAYVNKSAQVDKAVTDLNKLTFAEVGSQLASSLKSKIDTSVSAGVFGTVEQDKMLALYKYNKQQAEQIVNQTEAGGGDYIAPQVFSQKEGKYVDAPFTMVDQVGDDGTNSFTYKVKKYDTDVLMLDKDGNPIYDVDKSGGLNIADLVTPAKSTVSATVIASSAEVAGASASKGVTVNTVSDNSSTTTDQSQTVNYTSMLSSSRNAITDTEVMAEIF